MEHKQNTEHHHKESHHLPLIGISIGDVNGIGPEVLIKAFSDSRMFRFGKFVVYCNPHIISKWKKICKLEELQIFTVDSLDKIHSKRLNVIASGIEDYEVQPGKQDPKAGEIAYQSLQAATAHLKAGLIDGLVTCPINKANMPAEFSFPGHTEYLESELGSNQSLMVMASDMLKLAVATSHIPLSEVSKKLNKELIKKKVKTFAKSLDKDFRMPNAKIAVLGLNPHAGDEGKIGSEEFEIIVPAIKELKDENLMVFGPYSADGFFADGQWKKFDGVLAMYHDQGLIPFKTIAFDEGVNFTAGLDKVRTSVDHGTAYNIAGKNQADPSSMRSALFMAAEVISNRTNAPIQILSTKK
jgi:4-hydroxythreonine-4-phosphate dehydrogenase